MTTKDTLEQRLARLGRTLADEVSVADTVMKRITECTPPGARRSNRRPMWLFKPALILGSLVAAALVYEFAKFAGLVSITGRAWAAAEATPDPHKMIISIAAVLVLAVFFLVMFVNIPTALWRRTHTRRYPLLWIAGVGGAIAFLMGSVAWQWNTAPCPVGIDETLEVRGGNSPLVILGIRMEPPAGDSGTIELDVRNDGPTQQFLAFAYYAKWRHILGRVLPPWCQRRRKGQARASPLVRHYRV